MVEKYKIDNLIRDLDTLGVQEEVDLSFVYYNITEEATISQEIIEKEYKACLEYNDNHQNKITSVEVVYRHGIDIFSFSTPIKSVDSLITKFKDDSTVILKYHKNTNTGEINNLVLVIDNGLNNLREFHILTTYILRERFTFREESSILNLFFVTLKELPETYPILNAHSPKLSLIIK